MKKGFVIFGHIPEEPHAREVDLEDGDPPEDELTKSVHRIDIRTYGDDPTSASVDVYGINKERCIGVWRQVIYNLPLKEWWK